jgi:putative aldouronate transport system substrate-binding protein
MKVSFTGIAWGNGAEENGLVEQEFEKMLNLDMMVNWIPNTDYQARVNVMMATNNTTDVVQVMPLMGKFYYPQVVQAVRNGLFYDLAPYVIDNGFKNANAIMKNWPDIIWENSRFDGALYLLPRRLNDIASQSAVYYRKDLFRQYGLTEPTSIQELGQFFIDMSKRSGLYGTAFSSDDVDASFKSIAVAFTGVEDWGVDANGNFFFASFMPEYKDFLGWVKNLYDQGAIDPEFALNQIKTSSFEDGMSATRIKNWRDWNQSEDLVTTKWFAVHVPIGAEVWGFGPVMGPKAPMISIGDGSGMNQPVMISKKFPEQNLDRLLQALCRDDQDYLWFLHYGLEGTHYTMVDGQPSAITDDQKAEKNKGYVGGWNQILLDEDPDYINSKFERAHSSAAVIAQAEKMKTDGERLIQEYNLTNPILTLNSETYSSRWTNITKDLNANRVRVAMGQMSFNEWDAYVKGIVDSADYQKILTEFKAEYTTRK